MFQQSVLPPCPGRLDYNGTNTWRCHSVAWFVHSILTTGGSRCHDTPPESVTRFLLFTDGNMNARKTLHLLGKDKLFVCLSKNNEEKK